MTRIHPIAGLNAQAPTTQNVRLILRQRLDEMYSYAQYVDSPDHIQELHDLRIAAKRVRYSLEVFEEFLPEKSKAFAATLTQLQDELGSLHDSEVMLALLRQLLLGKEAETSAELVPPEMARAVLEPEHVAALSPKERSGLFGLLRRQEQRRSPK